MPYKLTFKQYAENSILIEWPTFIKEEILYDLLLFKKKIEINKVESIVEVVNGYCSLLVVYVCDIDNLYNEFLALDILYKTTEIEIDRNNILWEIPVSYTINKVPDLERYSKKKKLNIEEIITLHTKPIYTVYFMGFLPGFIYMGGLNSDLQINRKKTPDLKIAPGTVAIGGEQTGIYPIESPGGWYGIGKTPLRFFDLENSEVTFVKSGDKIKFKAISEEEYDDISSLVKNNNYTPKQIKYVR